MVNTDGKQKVASPNFFFYGVPRCGKCRIIMSYLIPILEDHHEMDTYLTLNQPMVCAEDIVHAKLRKFHATDKPFEDEITEDLGELTLAAEDKKRQQLDTTADKDQELADTSEHNVQGKAVRVAEILENGSTKLTRTELEAVERALRKLEPKAVDPLKDGATEKEKADWNAAKKGIDIENAKRAAGKAQKTSEKEIVKSAMDRNKNTRETLAKQVHAYLDTLKGFDLTGET